VETGRDFPWNKLHTKSLMTFSTDQDLDSEMANFLNTCKFIECLTLRSLNQNATLLLEILPQLRKLSIGAANEIVDTSIPELKNLRELVINTRRPLSLELFNQIVQRHFGPERAMSSKCNLMTRKLTVLGYDCIEECDMEWRGSHYLGSAVEEKQEEEHYGQNATAYSYSWT
jgi:hypothetical protein